MQATRIPGERGGSGPCFDHNEAVHAAEPPADDSTQSAPPPLVHGNPLDSLMPVILFIVLNRFAGLPWAIGAATAWSVKAAVTRKRRGLPIGKFLPIITIGIILRGIVGIVTDSEAVYFGIGIGTKAAIGVGLIVTALIGRNLVAAYAPLLFGFDRATVASLQYQSAMKHISIVAGIAQLVSAAFDVWLFNNSSVDGYLVIRMIVNWPLTTAVLLGSFVYLGKRLASLPGFPGINAVLEARMVQYEDAMRDRKQAR